MSDWPALPNGGGITPTHPLHRRGIPFTIANHDRLGDDPAVAALCAYLALAADPGCDPAFEAVLALPHHGLGKGLWAWVCWGEVLRCLKVSKAMQQLSGAEVSLEHPSPSGL